MIQPGSKLDLDADQPPSLAGRMLLGILLLFGWRQTAIHVPAAIRQYQAHAFPHVVGTMHRHEWRDVGTDGGRELDVEYEFSVDGVRYRGDRARFAYRAFASGSAEAVQLAKSWGVGRDVKVFYDPADPRIAALDNLFTPGDWKTLLSAAGINLGITLVLAAQIWRYASARLGVREKRFASEARESRLFPDLNVG